MEKRVFKEALFGYYKLTYAVVAVACLILVWLKIIIPAVVMVIIMLLITDRLVRGEYVMESGALMLNRGRFFKERAVLISEIERVERLKGSKSIRGSVVISMADDKIFLSPENPDGFVDALLKRNPNIILIND